MLERPARAPRALVLHSRHDGLHRITSAYSALGEVKGLIQLVDLHEGHRQVAMERINQQVVRAIRSLRHEFRALEHAHSILRTERIPCADQIRRSVVEDATHV